MSGFLIVLGMFVAAFAAGHSLKVRRRHKLADLAAHLGLTFERLSLGRPHGPAGLGGQAPDGDLGAPLLQRLLPMSESWRITGRIDGVPVEIHRAGRARWAGPAGADTGVRARLDRSLGLGLQITAQTSLDCLAQAMGAPDIEIGDQAFDQAVVVQARSEGQAQILLRDPGAQAAILDALALNKTARVDDEEVHARLPGFRTDPAELRPVLEALTRVALAIQRAHDRATPELRMSVGAVPG